MVLHCDGLQVKHVDIAVALVFNSLSRPDCTATHAYNVYLFKINSTCQMFTVFT